MRKVLPCSKTSYKVKKRIERVRHQHLITGDGWGRGYKKAFLCCGKGTICWVFVGSLPRCSTALPQQAVSSYLPTRQTHFVSISRLTSCCLLNDLQIFQSWREKKEKRLLNLTYRLSTWPATTPSPFLGPFWMTVTGRKEHELGW